jgi:WD40 repeat protein
LWERRARDAADAGDRDEAIRSWLQALRFSDTDARRRQVGELIQGDLAARGPAIADPFRVGRAAFTRDGTSLAAVVDGPRSEFGTVKVWEVASGRVLMAVARGNANPYGWFGLAFSGDGKALLLDRPRDESTYVFDVASGQQLLSSWSTRVIDCGHHRCLRRAIAFSPDLDKVITVEPCKKNDGNDVIRIWEVASGKPLSSFVAGGVAESAAFSEDGLSAALVMFPKAYVWSAKTGRFRAFTLAGNEEGWDASIHFELFGPFSYALLHDESSWSRIDLESGERSEIDREAVPVSPFRDREWAYYRDNIDVRQSGPWFHVYDLREKKILFNRFIPGAFALRMSIECDGHLCADVAIAGDKGVSFRRMDLAEVAGPPVVGDPEALVAEWNRKIGPPEP